MLFNTSREKAIAFLGTQLDTVANLGEVLQLVVVEMIRKVQWSVSPTTWTYVCEGGQNPP